MYAPISSFMQIPDGTAAYPVRRRVFSSARAPGASFFQTFWFRHGLRYVPWPRLAAAQVKFLSSDALTIVPELLTCLRWRRGIICGTIYVGHVTK